MSESVSDSLDTTTEQDVDYYALSDEEIVKKHEKIAKENELLKLENEMFEIYMKRVDIHPLNTKTQPFPLGMHDTSASRLGKKRQKSKSILSDRCLLLNSEQKCDIAVREIEEVKEEINKLIRNSEIVVDDYTAIMDEADIRLRELSKAYCEFEKDTQSAFQSGTVNNTKRNILAEKIVRYFEEKNRQRNTFIGKLRLKNSSLRVRRRKLIAQIRQKEEMGELLLEVDFKELKIENRQYLVKIQEKNVELLQLKKAAAQALLEFNRYKKKLAHSMAQTKRYQHEIQVRADLTTKVRQETITAEEDKQRAKINNAKLNEQFSAYRVPAVMDYVNCVAEDYVLKHDENIWKRKVDIANMSLDRHKRIWNQIKRTAPTATY